MRIIHQFCTQLQQGQWLDVLLDYELVRKARLAMDGNGEWSSLIKPKQGTIIVIYSWNVVHTTMAAASVAH